MFRSVPVVVGLFLFSCSSTSVCGYWRPSIANIKQQPNDVRKLPRHCRSLDTGRTAPNPDSGDNDSNFYSSYIGIGGDHVDDDDADAVCIFQ